ncbi:unnamed protein product [Triticum turgidum subsp. durum]|uniref:Uncharacterized protein n=1 Tax=Triticum turgidum subsp. durum TaxID=4567 RepID=A0A9R1QAR9_TRITD|nr:unnamed protein product [Triticum turgidum subsp. durum]
MVVVARVAVPLAVLLLAAAPLPLAALLPRRCTAPCPAATLLLAATWRAAVCAAAGCYCVHRPPLMLATIPASVVRSPCCCYCLSPPCCSLTRSMATKATGAVEGHRRRKGDRGEEGTMTDLPKMKKAKKAKFIVGIMEPKVGFHITEATRICCESNEYVHELLHVM